MVVIQLAFKHKVRFGAMILCLVGVKPSGQRCMCGSMMPAPLGTGGVVGACHCWRIYAG